MVTETRTTTIEEVLEAVKLGKTLINAVAGGKLVEGVEYTGPQGSLVGTVFIAGVPYPQPDDQLRDRLQALSRRLDPREARETLYELAAAIRVRQAIGRAQRSPRDRLLIVLGDNRFLRRRLSSHLRLAIDYAAVGLEDYSEAVRRAAARLRV